jgi:hypothetical protein
MLLLLPNMLALPFWCCYLLFMLTWLQYYHCFWAPGNCSHQHTSPKTWVKVQTGSGCCQKQPDFLASCVMLYCSLDYQFGMRKNFPILVFFLWNWTDSCKVPALFLRNFCVPNRPWACKEHCRHERNQVYKNRINCSYEISYGDILMFVTLVWICSQFKLVKNTAGMKGIICTKI